MNQQSLISFCFSVSRRVPPLFTLVRLAREVVTCPHPPSPHKESKGCPCSIPSKKVPMASPPIAGVPIAPRKYHTLVKNCSSFFFLILFLFFFFFFFSFQHGKTVQAQRLNKPMLHPWIVRNYQVPQPPGGPPAPQICLRHIRASSKATQSSNDSYYFISLLLYISLYIYKFVYPIYT